MDYISIFLQHDTSIHDKNLHTFGKICPMVIIFPLIYFELKFIPRSYEFEK